MKDYQYFNLLHEAVYKEILSIWETMPGLPTVVESAKREQIARVLNIKHYPGLCDFVSDTYGMSMNEWIDSYSSIKSLKKGE